MPETPLSILSMSSFSRPQGGSGHSPLPQCPFTQSYFDKLLCLHSAKGVILNRKMADPCVWSISGGNVFWM